MAVASCNERAGTRREPRRRLLEQRQKQDVKSAAAWWGFYKFSGYLSFICEMCFKKNLKSCLQGIFSKYSNLSDLEEDHLKTSQLCQISQKFTAPDESIPDNVVGTPVLWFFVSTGKCLHWSEQDQLQSIIAKIRRKCQILLCCYLQEKYDIGCSHEQVECF